MRSTNATQNSQNFISLVGSISVRTINDYERTDLTLRTLQLLSKKRRIISQYPRSRPSDSHMGMYCLERTYPDSQSSLRTDRTFAFPHLNVHTISHPVHTYVNAQLRCPYVHATEDVRASLEPVHAT